MIVDRLARGMQRLCQSFMIGLNYLMIFSAHGFPTVYKGYTICTDPNGGGHDGGTKRAKTIQRYVLNISILPPYQKTDRRMAGGLAFAMICLILHQIYLYSAVKTDHRKRQTTIMDQNAHFRT